MAHSASMTLTQRIDHAQDSFVVRRALRRWESGEITQARCVDIVATVAGDLLASVIVVAALLRRYPEPEWERQRGRGGCQPLKKPE